VTPPPNVIRQAERALRVAPGESVYARVDGVIRAGDLALPGGSLASSDGDLATLEQLERRHIAEVLERVDWHQGRAASLLGISSKTLYRKIREYGFQRPGGESEGE
jgi:two-component system NtrC family response regulator